MHPYDAAPLETLLDSRLPAGLGGRWYGVFPALVSDIKDPDGQGRVKVTLPWSPDGSGGRYEAWARLATFMAGSDPRRPCVIGAMWNGADSPPESMDGAGNNHKKVLRSRNGVKITLDDQDGQEKLIVETPGGQKITLKDGPGAVEIEDANGNSVKLESAGITIEASARVVVNASQVAVSASMVTVDAGMSRFSGVVQADTVIANTVISATYTPGAGNIW
jgi:uncharacterized protein involved in type VI secretion and phage assembly